MREATFKINGMDFIPYLEADGLEITRNDIDSDEAGMTLAGIARRDRVSVRYDIKATPVQKPTTLEEVTKVFNALRPQWVQVEFDDPDTGEVTTKNFYNARKSVKLFKTFSGESHWRIQSFNLIHEGQPEGEIL